MLGRGLAGQSVGLQRRRKTLSAWAVSAPSRWPWPNTWTSGLHPATPAVRSEVAHGIRLPLASTYVGRTVPWVSGIPSPSLSLHLPNASCVASVAATTTSPVSATAMNPSRFLSQASRIWARMLSPIISMRPAPNRWGVLRPVPASFGIVVPAPGSPNGMLWQVAHDATSSRGTVPPPPPACSRGAENPTSLPVSPNTPSRTRHCRMVRSRPMGVGQERIVGDEPEGRPLECGRTVNQTDARRLERPAAHVPRSVVRVVRGGARALGQLTVSRHRKETQ